MKVVVGIDIGGSTTKIAGFYKGELLQSVQVKANSPVASLFGAFGQFLLENKLNLQDIAEKNSCIDCNNVSELFGGLK